MLRPDDNHIFLLSGRAVCGMWLVGSDVRGEQLKYEKN